MKQVPSLGLESEDTVGLERLGRIGGLKGRKPLGPYLLSTVLWDTRVEHALAFRELAFSLEKEKTRIYINVDDERLI